MNHVEYTLARTRHQFDDFECYQAAAFSLRDRLIEMWNDTQTYFKCVGSMHTHTHITGNRATGTYWQLAILQQRCRIAVPWTGW